MADVSDRSEEILTELKAVDPSVLGEVVCQDQQSRAFKIKDWSVRRLSNKGIANPDGLFLFSGNGYDEVSETYLNPPVFLLSKIFLPESCLI